VADSQPLFLHLVGIDKLDAAGASTAEQRINNVEIMLVLDVSGSMASNSKIVNLRAAAKDFVATVLAKDTEHKISIGIVPFNGQVNLGPTLINYYTLTDQNGFAGVNCVDLPTSVYGTYAISQGLALPVTSNADTYSGTGTSTPSEANKWCPVTNGSTYYTGNPAGSGGNIVRLPQQDTTILQGYINGLTAVGATSINAGMKWGMTLLDTSSKNIYTSEIAAGRMPNTMATRPLAYDDKDAMKVIILMTDGENFPEERVNQTNNDPTGSGTGFKTGPSPFWQATSDSKWSIYYYNKVTWTSAATIAASRPYYVPTASTKWQARPWNGTTPLSSDNYVPVTPTAVPVGATQRTWPEVWSKMGMQYVASTFYASAIGGSVTTYMNLFRTQTDIATGNTPTMDNQLQLACNAAKDQNVIVYGIAFEAPANGQTQIRKCATSPAHYFDAQGLEIKTAFTAIANNISQLRLTQ
ncbi:MAG: VWA domain-containing protein, partial [Paracoccaceae bacterium]